MDWIRWACFSGVTSDSKIVSLFSLLSNMASPLLLLSLIGTIAGDELVLFDGLSLGKGRS